MKTKLLTILALMIMTTTAKAQEKETVKATFETVEDGTYYFLDADGFSLEFDEIAEEVRKSFNLMDVQYQGKTFIITFESEMETDDEGEDIMISKIVGLTLDE
ncbi:hypothetical protein FK220_004050 [Flavobacteriaceae bacterium TP-CH-4]|uniref:Uncharacterized protein n=1 Tax=Pelagihabitans pacificus TaxID=2696054 RepID=A0A967AXP6_9FLAO|nr:hypothetical protein [Pelagihabitans pacificus]NHF58496.1 hypothetical protein [Pelagihabitans pacificus]